MGLLLALTLAALPLPPVGPVPPWVDAVPVPPANASAEGALAIVLRDTQVLADGSLQYFDRTAWRVLTQAGIDALAHHELEWDPAYETLVLHGAWVWRDGQRRQAWHPDDARVVQREASVDKGLYDGRLTLMLELRDVRVGDVVEVASTVTGQNPAFQGHFAGSFAQAVGVPVGLQHFRLLWARQRPLTVRQYAGAQAPTVTTSAGRTEYAWRLSDTKGVDLEPRSPPDLEWYPRVEFSDWGTWSDVATWATGLFATPAPTGRLQGEVKRLSALPEAERLRAAVRFVQDDVRYVGVELGEHSHQPHAPAWVLERGFGDCKDKSSLLVALLRALGFDAAPALVHSSRGKRLPTVLPSATAFNHAIVRVQLADGPHFIDATESQRRGDPATWEPPLLHHALVVATTTTTLEALPAITSRAPTYEVTQHWKVPSYAGEAELVVEAVASGSEASSLRRAVTSIPRAELLETRREGREKELGVKLKAEKLDWTDDEVAERVTTREVYRVLDFFDEKQHHAFETLLVHDDLQGLDEKPRSTPASLWYPTRVKERLIYDGPETFAALRFDLTNRTFRHPAFELEVKQDVTGNRLTLEWGLTTLQDRVAPGDVASYRATRDDAWETFGFTVRQAAGEAPGRGKDKDTLSGQQRLWILVGCLVVVALVMAVLNRAPPTVEKPSLRARFKAWRFKAKQKGQPGELASAPLVVDAIDDAARAFRSPVCPVGHAWTPGLVVKDTVRLGDERIHVVARACPSCGAEEHRYVKLRG